MYIYVHAMKKQVCEALLKGLTILCNSSDTFPFHKSQVGINNLYFSIQWLINNQNVNASLPSDSKSDNEEQKEASRQYFIELLYSFGQHSHR